MRSSGSSAATPAAGFNDRHGPKVRGSEGSRSLAGPRPSLNPKPDCEESMDYQLKGKTAFVAAGAHGIGEAIANLLTQEGARVVVADLDAEVLAGKASKWAGTFAADLSTADGVERAVAHVVKTFGGPPDILINNLGVGNPYGLEEQT